MENNGELLGPWRKIRRTELVRIVTQCLYSLGYEKTAQVLELESGITCDSGEFKALEAQVLAGNWNDSIAVLDKELGGLTTEYRDRALVWILEECLLETMHAEGYLAAARALMEIGHSIGIENFNRLSSRILFPCPVKTYRIRHSGVQYMRKKLVSELKALMPSTIILPRSRMEHLVEIALSTQAKNCPYHIISGGPISLYGDHSCRDQFPTETIQTLILDKFAQQVTFIQFSNKGEYLASTLYSNSVLIWKVLDDNKVFQLHEMITYYDISFVSWSPDDSLLLIQYTENYNLLELWNVETATLKHSFKYVYVQCCAWLPSSRVVIGVCEQREIVHKINCDTLEIVSFDFKVGPIRNLAVTTRWGNWTFVWLSGDRDICIYSYPSDSWNIISEKHDITSLSLSEDGNLLIASIKNDKIHKWHIGGGWIQPASYMGHMHRQLQIQSCFGGPDSRFIASGSEDSKVYIWNCRGNSRPIPVAVLSGHSRFVKYVSWNPRRPQMIASLDADCHIRIWGPKRSG